MWNAAQKFAVYICVFIPLETKYYLLIISGFQISLLIQPVYNDAEDSATEGVL